MPNQHFARRPGVTLLELIVAISLIGILVTFTGVLHVGQYRETATRAQMQTDLAKYTSEQELFADMNNNYASSPSQISGFHWSDSTIVVSSTGTHTSWSITIKSARNTVQCSVTGGAGSAATNPSCN